MKLNKDYIINFISTQKPELQRKYGIKRIGLFGSYARDYAKKDSDIDIVVELEKPDLFMMIGVKQFLEDSLGTHVDIVRLRDKMNLALRKRIEKDAIYVWFRISERYSEKYSLGNRSNQSLLMNYPEINWKQAKGMRDIITHH